MNWNSVSDFIAMGGYGLYVWGSVGMTVAIVAAELWQLGARRRALAQLPQLPQRERSIDTGVPHEA